MPGAQSERSNVSRSRGGADRDLVSLATPVLRIIMQIKAGLIEPSDDLRRQIAGLLTQLEQRGSQLGYTEQHAQAVKFALAAFVDETVLTAQFPLRDEWEKNPLQLEYFGEHLAGVTFFNRLEAMLKDPASEVDVVEVYYLCLLIGYKGKFKIYYEQELKGVIEGVADYLRRLNRLRGGALSPHWKVTDQPEPIIDPGLPTWIKLTAGVSLAVLFLVYAILAFWLNSNVIAAHERLLR